MPGHTGSGLRTDFVGFLNTVDHFRIDAAWNEVLRHQTQRPVVIEVGICPDVGVHAVFRVVVFVVAEIAVVVVTHGDVVVEQIHALVFGCEAQ